MHLLLRLSTMFQMQKCSSHQLAGRLSGADGPLLLHQATQPAVEEELASLQRVLPLCWGVEGLAASELSGHSAAVVVAVGVL